MINAVKGLLPLTVLGVLRSFKRNILVMTFRERVVVHEFLGVRLKLHICDPTGKEWYDHDSENLEELGALSRIAAFEGKQNVFVLGAHQAVVSLVVSSLQGVAGRVVAVEGSRFNAQIASKNVEANGNERIEIVHALVSDEEGVANFVDVGNGYIGRNKSEMTINVDCVTIDQLTDRYGEPDLVMVDIEGVEWTALKVSKLVEARSCDWAVELHGDEVIGSYGGSNMSVARRFSELGYEMFRFEEGDMGRYVPIRDVQEIRPARTHIFCRAPR